MAGKVQSSESATVTRVSRADIIPGQPRVTDQLQALAQGKIVNPVYRWAVNGVPVEGSNGPYLPAGGFRKGDTVSVEIVADRVTFSAEAVISNTPPVVVKSALANPTIVGGADVEIVAETVDADADPVTLRYQWSINDESVADLDENRLPGELIRKGDKLGLTIVPSDGEESGSIFVLDPLKVAGSPPRMTSSPAAGFEGNLYSYVAQAVDPDGDAISYQLDVAPPGMTIDATTGQVVWQLSGQEQGDFPVRIIATDSDGLRAIQEYRLTIVLKY